MAVRARVLAMTLTLLVACSSSSSAPAATEAGAQMPPSTSITVRVPEGTTGCEGMQPQVVPDVADQDVVVGLAVSPWPEGPIADVHPGRSEYPPEWVAGFEAAAAAVPLPLPAPGPDGCCSRPGPFVLFVEFQSGATAVYGPCELPGGLDVVASILYDAAY